jgi:hypothetical protein
MDVLTKALADYQNALVTIFYYILEIERMGYAS